MRRSPSRMRCDISREATKFIGRVSLKPCAWHSPALQPVGTCNRNTMEQFTPTRVLYGMLAEGRFASGRELTVRGSWGWIPAALLVTDMYTAAAIAELIERGQCERAARLDARWLRATAKPGVTVGPPYELFHTRAQRRAAVRMRDRKRRIPEQWMTSSTLAGCGGIGQQRCSSPCNAKAIHAFLVEGWNTS